MGVSERADKEAKRNVQGGLSRSLFDLCIQRLTLAGRLAIDG
jgi:hypothetical protein